eukprot:scaffold1332_cov166-Amphora_coffeaeformis.AAC.8
MAHEVDFREKDLGVGANNLHTRTHPHIPQDLDWLDTQASSKYSNWPPPATKYPTVSSRSDRKKHLSTPHEAFLVRFMSFQGYEERVVASSSFCAIDEVDRPELAAQTMLFVTARFKQRSNSRKAAVIIKSTVLSSTHFIFRFCFIIVIVINQNQPRSETSQHVTQQCRPPKCCWGRHGRGSSHEQDKKLWH